jgi:hypothetical protein
MIQLERRGKNIGFLIEGHYKRENHFPITLSLFCVIFQDTSVLQTSDTCHNNNNNDNYLIIKIGCLITLLQERTLYCIFLIVGPSIL